MSANEVIIIGAPRSGTNMLRDVLSSFDDVGTWPCDEINYIWRHGNIRYPSDEFPAELATPNVVKYIRARFEALRVSQGVKVVLEKTCANCLRIPFVDRVVPDARYIHIYRDGIDAVGSAKLRWTAELDIGYILEKVRYVPLTDLPYYGSRYIWNRMYRLLSSEKRLAFWGPVLSDMDKILGVHTLEEVCALQWQRCVESAESALATMPANRVVRLDYEDFVTNPEAELTRILDFMNLDVSTQRLRQAVAGVSSNSIGKGRQAMPADQISNLEKLVGNTLERYGRH